MENIADLFADGNKSSNRLHVNELTTSTAAAGQTGFDGHFRRP
jgi:hypothetical protein